MDYSNLLKRSLTSIFLFLIFLMIILNFENYLKFLIYIIYVIIFFEIVFFFSKIKSILLISISYLLFSIACMQLYFINFYTKDFFLYVIIIIIIFDTSSYLIGSSIGKKKILPKISPNKTFEGVISGLIISLILGYFINHYYFSISLNEFIFIILLVFFAFLGDVFESFFKRKLKIKNSSNFLPGHGGFFDRFDSFIMVIIFLFFYNIFF